MELTSIQIVLRPRTLFEILDLGLIFIRKFAPGLALIGLIFILPLTLINPLIIRALGWEWSSAYLLWMAEMPIIHLPIVLYSSEALFNQKAQAHVAIRQTLRALPRLLLDVLFRAVLILTFIGIIILSFVHRHYLEIRYLEGLRGSDYSKRLSFFRGADHNGSAMLVLMTVLSVAGGFCIWIGLDFLLTIAFGATHSKYTTEIVSPYVWSTLTVLPMLIYWPVVDFLTYIDARTRTEGWDLGLQLRYGDLA